MSTISSASNSLGLEQPGRELVQILHGQQDHEHERDEDGHHHAQEGVSALARPADQLPGAREESRSRGRAEGDGPRYRGRSSTCAL